MVYFAVVTTYQVEPAPRLEARPRHRAYLAGLRQKGVVVLAGPWADGSGGLVIYAVADRAELALILTKDPYVVAGVIERFDIREWTAVIDPASPVKSPDS